MNKKTNEIAIFIKQARKKAGYSQKEFSIISGLGLRFIRELEQGKTTLKWDKVNEALAMFGKTCVVGDLKHDDL